MQEQKKFRYVYNGKEVDRERFEELTSDSFKWFSEKGIESVPFSSFDNFFNGEFKNKRQINDHLNSVLDIYKNKVTEDIINKPRCSPQCFYDGSCKKPQQKNLCGYNKPTIKGSSTRHKSQAGETHAENKVFFIPPNFTGWFFDNEDRPDIKNFDTIKDAENYFYKSKNTIGRIFKDKEIVKELKKEDKDDVITSSNRGEKETMEYLQGVKEVLPSHNLYDNSNYWKHSLENWTDRLVGVKESQSVDKAPIFTYCKVNKNALEALAFRALYGHKKYNKNGEDEDWQNFTRVPNAEEEYANAEFRHALEIGGEETTEEHLIASAWNAVSRLEIFLRNKSK